MGELLSPAVVNHLTDLMATVHERKHELVTAPAHPRPAPTRRGTHAASLNRGTIDQPPAADHRAFKLAAPDELGDSLR